MHGGFGQLADADQKQPLGSKACRSVQEECFVGCGFEFAAVEHCLQRSLHDRV